MQVRITDVPASFAHLGFFIVTIPIVLLLLHFLIFMLKAGPHFACYTCIALYLPLCASGGEKKNQFVLSITNSFPTKSDLPFSLTGRWLLLPHAGIPWKASSSYWVLFLFGLVVFLFPHIFWHWFLFFTETLYLLKPYV